FTPDESIGFIRYMWDHLRASVWGAYGWKDGFNPTVGWIGPDVIGIDQGPILLMIENYRTGKPWARFMTLPAIQQGLARADFQQFILGVTPPQVSALELSRVEPDPVRGRSRVTFRLPRRSAVDVALLDVQGRSLRQLASGSFEAGEHSLAVDRGDLHAGIYWLRLRSGSELRRPGFVVLP